MSSSAGFPMPIRSLLRRQAAALALVGLLSLVVAAGTLAGQWLYRSVFDVLLPTRDPGVLARALAVIGGVALAILLANAGTSFLTRAFRSRFARELREVVVERTLDLPTLHLGRQTPAVTFQRLIPDLDSVSRAAGHLVSAAACAGQLAVILAFIGWIDARVVLVSLAMSAAYAISSLLIAPALHAALARRNAWVERRGAFSLSVLPSIKDVKSLGLHRRFLEEHARLSREARPVVLASAFWESFATEGAAVPARLGALGIFAVGFAAVASGRHTPGMVMTLVASAGALVWPLSTLFDSLTAARNEWPAITRLRRHLRAAPEPSGWRVMGEVREGIRVNRLRYAYPGARAPVLDDLSVEFPVGSFTAVTGPSGSGKTTLLDVLTKIHPCQPGAVSIDGIDLCDVDSSSLRERIGYVGQDPLLFTDSLRGNIDPHERLGAAELRELCRALELDALVKSLPAGLDGLVAENGANLSGGERQRVGIARALAKGVGVLILDEATAALDERVERRVIEVLRDWMAAGRRTIVAVTHSQAVVRAADRVLRLETGRLVGGPVLPVTQFAGAAQP